MNENDQEKQVSDSITFKEEIVIVRYKGSKIIREIMEKMSISRLLSTR